MYKNVLVISDNIFLEDAFKEIILEKAFNEINFTFSTTSCVEFVAAGPKGSIVFDLNDVEQVQEIIDKYALVISLHCKQLFPKTLTKNVKCINLHPGYNPSTRGWYPHVFAILNDLPAGATIHEMDEFIDNGKIIDRGTVDKEIYDTSESLYNRILLKEIELLKRNLIKIVTGKYEAFEAKEKGELFQKKDYDDLKEFRLDEKISTLDFINRLRALTHGSFKNAYFVNPSTGKKVFISINIDSGE